MNKQLIGMLKALPAIRILSYLLVIVVAIMLILRIFNIKGLLVERAVSRTVDGIQRSRSRDYYILNTNKLLMSLAKIVQKSPFAISKTAVEYVQYNLNRADIKAPGGRRKLSAEEFNAIKVTLLLILLIISAIIAIVGSILAGVVLGVVSVVGCTTMPMQLIRASVKHKDVEIQENFSDFYLMLHYVLITGAKTSVSKVMGTYSRATDSVEIKRFIGVSTDLMDTHGELEATRYIAKEYREIPEVNRLMRLIRQLYDGGDVTNDLMGFRDELIKKRRNLIISKMERSVTKAKVSFNILIIILIQAVISAMAIYLPSMSGASSFL